MAHVGDSVHVRDHREMTVRFLATVLRTVVRAADCTANEDFPDALASTVGDSVWVYADLDARNGQARRSLRGRLVPHPCPKVKRVNRPLKRLNDLYTATRIVANEGAVGLIIATLLKGDDGLRNRAVHRFRLDQASCDALSGQLVLDDQRSRLAGVFRLPQDRHLSDGRGRGEVVSELRRRQAGLFANRRTRHG